MEPVVLPAHVWAGSGLPQEEPRELVPAVRNRARERAGGERLLLAARRYAGDRARTGTVVPEDHSLCRTPAGGHERTGVLAGARAGHAAELDWKVERHVCGLYPGGLRRADSGVYHSRGYDLRLLRPAAGARASPR